MKKNWLQIVTLCLCAILLAVTIDQGRRLDEFQLQMENELQNLSSSVSNEIWRISDSVAQEMEEAALLVSEYELEPVAIDKVDRALLADVSVTLKEWYADTEVTLLAAMGEEKVSVPLEGDGNGTFAARVSLPLEGDFEIILDALISGGGKTKREMLDAWSDYSMLLPFYNGGGGWTGPDYQDGTMSSQFYITLESYDGELGPLQNPEFRIYKNGELIQTYAAVIDPYASADMGNCYTVDTIDRVWSIQCGDGDVIDIRFRCEDEFGLGYDFLFMTCGVEDGMVVSGESMSKAEFELYWPE